MPACGVGARGGPAASGRLTSGRGELAPYPGQFAPGAVELVVGLVALAVDQGHLVLQGHDHRGRGEGEALVEQHADPGGEGQLPARPAPVPAGGALRTDHPTRVQTPEERRLHPEELRRLTRCQSGNILVEALGAHGFRRVLAFVFLRSPTRR